MFVDVNDGSTTPGEEEITKTSAKDDGNTEPDVVGHEDKHQNVAHRHLQDVKQSLDGVSQTHHALTMTTTTSASPIKSINQNCQSASSKTKSSINKLQNSIIL